MYDGDDDDDDDEERRFTAAPEYYNIYLIDFTALFSTEEEIQVEISVLFISDSTRL